MGGDEGLEFFSTGDEGWDRMSGRQGMTKCVSINEAANAGDGRVEGFGMVCDGRGGIVGCNEGLEERGHSGIVVRVKKSGIRKEPR